MGSEGILPDTCAWIDYFRNNPSGLAKGIEDALATDSVHICGAIICELVQGVKSEKEEARLLGPLRGLAYLEMSETLWTKAGRLAATLRKKGISIPFSDIIIASVAIEHNVAVLTVDRHFEQIPGVRVCSGA